MVTRDRRERVLHALERMPPGVPVCLVDNASADGTAAAVRERFPTVDVLEPGRNLGSAARTLGARHLNMPFTAFADDDSWWAPGALERAAAALERFPRLALVAARVLVGPQEALDPTCAAMGAGGLPASGRPLPGPAVLGFVACGAVVRTSAFLSVGGFSPRYGIGGEERRLAADLAVAGWDLAYLDDVVAHHHPGREARPGRSWRVVRNDVWSAWLDRPAGAAVRRTARVLAAAPPAVALRAGAEAVRGLPWVLRERRVAPPEVQAALAHLERDG